MLVSRLLLPLLHGCAGGDACEGAAEGACDTSEATPRVDTGVPIFAQEDPTPEWTAIDVGDTLREVLAHGFPNAQALKETYLGMMANGDASCPGSDTILSEAYILGCVAPSGYFYSGVCVYEGNVLENEAGTTTSWGLGGDFLLEYPDGDVFEAGGGATWSGQQTPDGDETYESALRGTWIDASSETWLGQGFSGLFEARGGVRAGEPWVAIDGGVAIGDADLYFDDLRWDWGGPCRGTPAGSVRLRDTRGYWYVWSLEGDCDICGDVVFHGDTNLGPLCLDLQPLGADVWHSLAMP
ncbi:MAG: hypothetical protein Q8P18_06675 [Pseudomonadota bacterium]|nr:hypothetical protein [Pseudomonadota bacterium]